MLLGPEPRIELELSHSSIHVRSQIARFDLDKERSAGCENYRINLIAVGVSRLINDDAGSAQNPGELPHLSLPPPDLLCPDCFLWPDSVGGCVLISTKSLGRCRVRQLVVQTRVAITGQRTAIDEPGSGVPDFVCVYVQPGYDVPLRGCLKTLAVVVCG